MHLNKLIESKKIFYKVNGKKHFKVLQPPPFSHDDFFFLLVLVGFYVNNFFNYTIEEKYNILQILFLQRMEN